MARTIPADGAQPSVNRLLLRASRQGGAWVVVLVLTVIVLTAAETALPAVLGRTIDGVLGRGSPGHWLLWTSVLIVVLVMCDVLDELGSTAATARSTAWLRRTSLRHVLTVRLRTLDRFSPGELVTRLVGNTEAAGGAAPDMVAGLASLVLAVAGVVALAVIDPWLCLTFVAGMPILTLMLVAFAKDASELSERYLETQGVIASRLVQALSGARTIAAAGTTERETARVLEPLDDLHRHGKGMWRAQTTIATQDTLLLSLLEIAVLAVAGIELSRGRITPGELFAATQYVALASTFSSSISSLSGLIRERAAVARLHEILTLPTVGYGDVPLPPGSGRLELRGVTAKVQDRVVLEQLSVLVPGGTFLAVVGRSGSGKTLFAQLAGRLVDPDQGDILLDDVPLRHLTRTDLRQAIGYGFERPALLGETVADVIAFGAGPVSDEQVVAAARAARADEFILRMPAGYQTALSDAPLSGGETQRLGLARVFAHSHRVLILDDVAASLDTVTEHEISRALTGALSETTRILVAHRASTAARADVVLWLDRGRMRGLAPHGALWRDPEYRQIFEPPDEQAQMPAGAVSGGVRA